MTVATYYHGRGNANMSTRAVGRTCDSAHRQPTRHLSRLCLDEPLVTRDCCARVWVSGGVGESGALQSRP
jgi:hypothetical protein